MTDEQKKLVEKALVWHPRGVYLCEPEIFQALIAEVKRLREIVGKLPTSLQEVPMTHPLALGLSDAWLRYRNTFGVEPNGTPQQMGAMLEFVPKQAAEAARKGAGNETDA